MSLAVATGRAAYRLDTRGSAGAAVKRSAGDMVGKVCILILFSAMATRLAQDFVETGHITGLLLLASEALVVALTLVRRPAEVVDRTWKARALTMFSTFCPPLLRPAAVAALGPESLTVMISAVGLMIVVLGKISLGRSFGLTPANRGVVCSGVYRFVRHPIYLGYLITHVGFVMAYPAGWNLGVLVAADVALMLRAICEERTLALDPSYRAYMDRVRWRIFPGVF
jgi:protein-S-isoprenylcysteine O-methyltransferase Ste14